MEWQARVHESRLPLDHQTIRVQNTIVEEALRTLILVRIGRDYFDTQEVVSWNLL